MVRRLKAIFRSARQLRGIIIIALFWCSLSLPGLNPDKPVDRYRVDKWDISAGIPSDSIRSITQTPDGYLWIGTNNGLFRVTGKRTGKYTTGDGLSNDMIDDTLRTFLNDKDPDWKDTQTIAPANVFAKAISNSSIRVSWTTIIYTGDTGGYNIHYSTTPGGPYKYSGMTADKSTGAGY
jgi:hypothetical protein